MDQIYVPKYPALIATPKIVDIVEKLALDIGEKQPTVLAEPVLQGSLNVEGKKNIKYFLRPYPTDRES